MTTPADRIFYSLPQDATQTKDDANTCGKDSNEKLLNYIRENVIGCDKHFSGPFGLRKVVYLDYIASGRALSFIEDYIRDEVLPEYGNTHTTTGVTSLQTTLFRHEARDIIRNSVNASEHDSVIFVGSGTTGAIHKLIHALKLENPVVFVGPYEHHSNLLPWKEITAEVVRIKQLDNGLIDIGCLETQLQKWKNSKRQLIGSFSAASNITGILADVDNITACLHRHGALSFWDYATAAPYVNIDMNPVVMGDNEKFVYKDAVFLSPHKFIGGVSTPGVLVAKKYLFCNTVPECGGGGSVFFVRRESHRYLKEPEMREEGGTPAIVESVRAGLVFQLKEAVTVDTIMERETFLLEKAKKYWKDCENLVILGNLDVPRLPVFSFLIYHPETGRFLHYNFVSAVLNDLFGIQARGGCACAGPYALDLLGLGELKAEMLENLLLEDWRLDRVHLRRLRECSHKEILRPGFTRLSLPYFIDDSCLQFVLEAIQLVAQHAHSLLPQYNFNPETGEWRKKNFQAFKDRKWLGHISYKTGEMKLKIPPQTEKASLPKDYQECLQMAREIFTSCKKSKVLLSDQTLLFDEESEPFRWFVLPSEAYECLHNGRVIHLPLESLPFIPLSLQSRFNQCYKNTAVSQSECRAESHTEDSGSSENTGEVSNITGHTEVQSAQCHSVIEKQDISGMSVSGSSCYVLVDKMQDEKNEIGNNRCVCCAVEDLSVEVRDGSEEGNDTSHSVSAVTKHSKLGVQTDRNIETCRQKEDKSDKCLLIKREEKRSDFDDKVRKNTIHRDKEQAHLDTNVRTVSTFDTSKHNNKWVSPPKIIFKPLVKAIEEYNMIQPGDRVLVCLSGGKDSLSLLHTIRQYQFYVRGKGMSFEFGAVTVDPETPAYDPSPLKPYLRQLGVPYFYESQGIIETAENLPYECASICSFCSRMKRGRIYAAARREGYNVLALGQHLDDIAESFLMSFFHNGIIRTMKAHYTVSEGDLRVIRPFVYVREKDLRNFAEKNKLPVIPENCPACFEAPKERHRTKQLLATQELLFPHLYHSMMAALKPVMSQEQAGKMSHKLPKK